MGSEMCIRDSLKGPKGLKSWTSPTYTAFVNFLFQLTKAV